MEKFANLLLCTNVNERQIEDVIDARKKKGQYDIHKHLEVPEKNLCRNACSDPQTDVNDEHRQNRIENSFWVSDGDLCSYSGDPGVFDIGPSDSEVTVVRVKQKRIFNKTQENKWNMRDDAIPGDGTHLGESPSLVNLATLVAQTENNKNYESNEYLVPLSSWDPTDNPYSLPEVCLNSVESFNSKLRVIKSPNKPERRLGLAGRITSFLRKRCLRKSKTSVPEKTQGASR